MHEKNRLEKKQSSIKKKRERKNPHQTYKL